MGILTKERGERGERASVSQINTEREKERERRRE